jgi:hypothetical protein
MAFAELTAHAELAEDALILTAPPGSVNHRTPSHQADPLEIAKLAVYLVSDDSAYVVGADFLIDGGVTAISGVGA